MASDRPDNGACGSYRVRLTLCDSDPPIVREIAVPKFATLFDLHNSIQSCFGWSDYHMHVFSYGGDEFGIPSDDFPDWEDETLVLLSDFEDDELDYNYDFGDNWHIAVEILGDAPNDKRWTELLSWENDGPPEDCGGIYGFYEKLETLSDPSSEDYEDVAEFMEGHEFNEEDAINRLHCLMPQGIRPIEAYIAMPIIPMMLMIPVCAASPEPIAFDLEAELPFIITDRPIRKSKRRDGIEEPPKVYRKDVIADPERYVVFSEDPSKIFIDIAAGFFEEHSIPLPSACSNSMEFLDKVIGAIDRKGLLPEWDDFFMPSVCRHVYDWAAEHDIYFITLEEPALSPLETMFKGFHDAVEDGEDPEELIEALMKSAGMKDGKS